MIDTLWELKAIGVMLAIDDFGTGYSSLSYLRRFPVDVIKVDQSFVAGLGPDPEDSTIVAAIVNLAHTLELEAIAEGVETAEQLERLLALGCHLAQGYYFAEPAEPDQVGAMIDRGFPPRPPPTAGRGGVRPASVEAAGPGGEQRGVAAAVGDELVVGAELDQAAAVDHADPVGPLGGREPVGDDHDGAALHEPLHAPARRAARCPGRGSRWPRRAPAPPGSARAARASDTSCFSPAESREPRSRTSVSSPSGSAANRSSTPIARERLVDLGVGGVGPGRCGRCRGWCR